MKLFLFSLVSLILVVVLAAAIGYAPTQDRWGDEGVRSMIAVSTICLIAVLIGGLPMVIIAPRWPDQIGQAVLAGTGIRLILTIFLGIGYQVLMQPHLDSFLFWAVVVYLLLLSVETTFGIVAIRRYYKAPQKTTEGVSA